MLYKVFGGVMTSAEAAL
jgi:hypothetical protein